MTIAPPTRPPRRPAAEAAHGAESAAQRRAAGWWSSLFLAPTVIGLTLFTLLPIVASILLAFFRWDVISAPGSPAWTTSSTSAPTRPSGSRFSTPSRS